MRDVCAVFVTYNPDADLLEKGVCAACEEVGKVYVIDNGSDRSPDIAYEKVKTILFPENKGIAAAFNEGIRCAASDGFRYVLLFDQDSIPPRGMVRRYREVYDALTSAGVRISALGPRYRDRRTGHISRFVRYGWLRNLYAGNDRSSVAISADFLISSGSFYEIGVFDEVGTFDENLFIDHVDTEWFHRAHDRGLCAFGLWDVILDHAMGESSVRLRSGYWHQPIHKPFRLYYIVRNSLLIYRKPYVPIKWIISDLLRLARLFGVYLLFSPHRRESITWIHRGIRDGLQGQGGPVQVNSSRPEHP